MLIPHKERAATMMGANMVRKRPTNMKQLSRQPGEVAMVLSEGPYQGQTIRKGQNSSLARYAINRVMHKYRINSRSQEYSVFRAKRVFCAPL